MRRFELPGFPRIDTAMRGAAGALTGPYTAAFVVLALCLAASGMMNDAPPTETITSIPRSAAAPDGTEPDEPCLREPTECSGSPGCANKPTCRSPHE